MSPFLDVHFSISCSHPHSDEAQCPKGDSFMGCHWTPQILNFLVFSWFHYFPLGRLIINYSLKSLSLLVGELHRDLLSPIFLNLGSASWFDSQWKDFGQRSDLWKGEPEPSLFPSLPPRTQVAPCKILKCQSSTGPMRGKDCIAQWWEGGWTDIKRSNNGKYHQPRESTILLRALLGWSLNGRK